MTSGAFSLDVVGLWVMTVTASCQKWGDRHFKLRIGRRARCSTFNIQRCHFQAQRAPSPNSNRVNTWSCSWVLYSESKLLCYMAQTSRSNKGGVQKPKGGARQQGRKNAFSGIRLEFLELYKDQFLDSTDCGGFYTLVARGFIQQFGYGYSTAVQDNSEPCGDDDNHSPEDPDSSLPLDEKNLDSVQQNKFYLGLRNVSNLLHKCGAELTPSCIRSSVAGIGTDTHPKIPMSPM